MNTKDNNLKKYGPLKNLIGVWESSLGVDVAPSENRDEETTSFFERTTYEDIGLVDNHEQLLYGLRYRTEITRIGKESLFHQELGYIMWDAESNTVMRCFTIPRGIAIIAGGVVSETGVSMTLKAEHGSSTFGVCANAFLEKEFKIIDFICHYDLSEKNTYSYKQNTRMEMPGREDLFEHTDQNSLTRV